MAIFLSIRNEKTKKRFEEIYYTYSRYLYTIGLKILKDEELAADALQHCYFKIYQNIDNVQDINSKQTRSFFGAIMRDEAWMIYNRYFTANHAAEPLADEVFEGFDQQDIGRSDIHAPKDIELKILDMADNFNKLRSREQKRNRLKIYIQAAVVVIIAAAAIFVTLTVN